MKLKAIRRQRTIQNVLFFGFGAGMWGSIAIVAAVAAVKGF